ncbi:hypothetical protein HUJ05_010984 [Dendroctonus ponderosae]|nr:hypothetical protein HUJ05_010984 [Dendroctonus ponderosae]
MRSPIRVGNEPTLNGAELAAEELDDSNSFTSATPENSNLPLLQIFYVLLLLLALLALLGRPRGLPPGPWGLPLLGYLPWIDPKAPHLTLARLARKFGPIYSLTLGRVCAIVLTDPRTIRRLLAKDATSGRAPLYVTHGIMHGYEEPPVEGT